MSRLYSHISFLLKPCPGSLFLRRACQNCAIFNGELLIGNTRTFDLVGALQCPPCMPIVNCQTKLKLLNKVSADHSSVSSKLNT